MRAGRGRGDDRWRRATGPGGEGALLPEVARLVKGPTTGAGERDAPAPRGRSEQPRANLPR